MNHFFTILSIIVALTSFSSALAEESVTAPDSAELSDSSVSHLGVSSVLPFGQSSAIVTNSVVSDAVSVTALTTAVSGEEESDDAPAPTSAAEVLASTIARFPTDSFSFSGSLILRKQAGVLVREIPFQAQFNWGDRPATATYTLSDSFGRPLNTMQISREANGEIEALYLDANGAPLPTPPLTAPVAGTDITWLDITLSYLWWQNGSLQGTESFKGALCDIIEMHPPQPIPGCAAVRLWVDRKRGFMRQAAQIDENGERVRWMWVSSVGKINDRWMIKNLEVKRPGTGMQTKLHVDDLESL